MSKKRIVASIYPFVAFQSIQIYNDSKLERHIPVHLEDVSKTIFNLCKEEKIEQVDIKGDKAFTQKIKDKILASDKFNTMNINVDLH